MPVVARVILICAFLSAIVVKSVYSINCYQCSGTDSDNPFDCNEFLESETDLATSDCASIHNAQYCIKHVGRYEGGISTKRFCSSLDLGNYCNYVQQVGDKLEYRTCIYTCGTDGCNAAGTLCVSSFMVVFGLFLYKFVM